MKRMITALASVLALTGLSAPGLAEVSKTETDPADVNIAGEWSFVANTGVDCTFSGNALLIETEDPTRFDCELTAVQVCSTSTWQVRQSCAASQVNDSVVIVSEIEEFIQGEPNQGYRPDNFRLTIRSSDLMKGALISWGFHLAEFRRMEGTIS